MTAWRTLRIRRSSAEKAGSSKRSLTNSSMATFARSAGSSIVRAASATASATTLRASSL
ncbi:MAG: hypothetical protein M3R38_04685 [Actinomycetota bacterium]|nr:hypothetical protein [Actinomycetota bacterium]